MKRARKMAEKALRALGKEDLLYPHHGNVCARAEAYDRLAEFFEEYARTVPADPQSEALRRRPDQEPR